MNLTVNQIRMANRDCRQAGHADIHDCLILVTAWRPRHRAGGPRWTMGRLSGPGQQRVGEGEEHRDGHADQEGRVDQSGRPALCGLQHRHQLRLARGRLWELQPMMPIPMQAPMAQTDDDAEAGAV